MILAYIFWGENTKDDTVAGFEKLGHEVRVLEFVPMKSYDNNVGLMEALRKEIREGANAAFSYDYLPDASRVCEEEGVPYLSWFYDCPVLTAQSKTITNECNYIFSFDARQCEALQSRGARHVYYLPLGVNVQRICETVGQDQLGRLDQREVANGKSAKNAGGKKYDISFMGNLYDDENFFFAQIKYIPDYFRGYLDVIMDAQLQVQGEHLIDQLFAEIETEELAKYAAVDLGNEYTTDRTEIFRDWLYKAVTVKERRERLKEIGDAFDLVIASQKKPRGIRAKYVGYLDYHRDMPKFFADSRINLNLTLRSIRHGIPLRCLDIMAAGGFLLSNYQPAFEELFENGRELVWFYDQNDMMEKIAYYLSHEEERREIASNGQQAAGAFSYDKQLALMLEVIPL